MSSSNIWKPGEVIIDIKTMIEHTEDRFLSPTCCIYEVPQTIRDLRKDAYSPKVISIGPFHHGNVRLQNMEMRKEIFFKRFTKEAVTNLDELVSRVEQLEPKVRAFYSRNIKLSKKELVKVILVDAGFIIELFRKIYKGSRLENDSELSQPWLVDAIIMDLVLLENQLPFFFLEHLFNIAFPLEHRGDIPSFRELTYDFFNLFNLQNLEPDHNANIKHFTDLLRLFYLQREKPKRDPLLDVRKDVLLYSANALQEAGVKLKVSKSECLLDLKVTGHVLEIPQISMEDRTETLFRNMIALEQCHYPYESYITDYAFLLDCLINTNKDVDVLMCKKIIHNYQGDSIDVAKAINGLLKNIALANFSYDYLEICRMLNGFCQDPWHNRKTTLRRDYCKTAWQTAVSFGGIALLILSLVQAIFSVLQVVLKK